MAFRTSLGVVFSGGGAHGAWQAGVSSAFAEAGLSFERIQGVSIGSISGVAYALGETGKAVEFWSDIDRLRIMRFAPRLSPFSLFSGRPLWDALTYIKDEELSRSKLRCELTVVALCREDNRYHYARFTPEGKAGWDGPLVGKLVASCSVPRVFPPVRLPIDGRERTLVDGAVIGGEAPSFKAVAGCSDVIVVQLVRPEDIGGFQPLKRLRGDPLGWDLVRATEDLKRSPGAPRVFRLYPSAPLRYGSFTFRSRECSAAVEHGLRDGRAFLDAPDRFLV